MQTRGLCYAVRHRAAARLRALIRRTVSIHPPSAAGPDASTHGHRGCDDEGAAFGVRVEVRERRAQDGHLAFDVDGVALDVFDKFSVGNLQHPLSSAQSPSPAVPCPTRAPACRAGLQTWRTASIPGPAAGQPRHSRDRHTPARVADDISALEESTHRVPDDDVNPSKRLDRLTDAPLAIRNDARVLAPTASAPFFFHSTKSKMGPQRTHPLDDGRPDAKLLAEARGELARGLLALDIVDGDVGALAGELLGDERAEAARAGSDEHAPRAEGVGHVFVLAGPVMRGALGLS